jgi:hypothetical protein
MRPQFALGGTLARDLSPPGPDLQILILPAALMVSRRERSRSDLLLLGALLLLAPLSLTGVNLMTPV